MYTEIINMKNTKKDTNNDTIVDGLNEYVLDINKKLVTLEENYKNKSDYKH